MGEKPRSKCELGNRIAQPYNSRSLHVAYGRVTLILVHHYNYVAKEKKVKIKTTFKAIMAGLYGTVRNMTQELVTNGSENLMIGGNKAYYLGGGW